MRASTRGSSTTSRSGGIRRRTSARRGGRPRGAGAKGMGLAPYGDVSVHRNAMRELVRLDGLCELNLEYFTHHSQGVDMSWAEGSPTIGRVFSKRLEDAFGPAREPASELTKHYEDVAGALQAVLEEGYLHLVRHAHERTGSTNLCLAGGVALNAVANGRIRAETGFDGLYIQPAAGDSGIAVGAAYYVWNQVLGRPRGFVMEHAYTGPQYSDEEYEAALHEAELEFERLDDTDL